MATYTRRQYAGAAASTTTTGAINTTDTTVVISATTGWPSTAGVPFHVVIDPGTSIEEKMLCTISGSALTMTRGSDGTSAASHAAGAVVYPVFTATDANEANAVATTMTTKGDLLVTTGTAYNRLPVGTDGQALVASAAATNGVTWATPTDTTKVALSTFTTKGDIVAATAASTVARTGVGTNGLALVANSANANGIGWAQVATAGITDLNVTTVKIADLNVTTAKIADVNVTTAKIADANVTQAKLAARAVGSGELKEITLNAQTSSYTAVLLDAQKIVTMNLGTSLNFNIPTDASVAFAIGDQINILQLGAGQVTIAAVTPGTTTLVSQGSKFKTNGQYSMATVVKVAANNWVVLGNLAV